MREKRMVRVGVGDAGGGATPLAMRVESATDSGASDAKVLACDASCDAAARCGSDVCFDFCLFSCDAIG